MEWKGLKYKGKDFETMEINKQGIIRNKEYKNELKTNWIGNILYTSIYVEGKAYRIGIGMAQKESGWKRTVLNKERKKKNKPREPFTPKQLKVINQIIEDALMEKLPKIIQMLNKE